MSAFEGNHEGTTSILGPLERRLIALLLPRIPSWLQTYHLTLLTLPWCAGILLASWLAAFHAQWLWLVSLFIVCQYLTDILDGAVGRLRNTGLKRWGYYMDHLLDYFFLCSVLIGYLFIVDIRWVYELFFILAIFAGYMVNSFLAFGVTDDLRITYLRIGPTEVRLAFIVANTLLAIFGTTHLGALLPYALLFSAIGLFMTVYDRQWKIWNMDMGEKRQQSNTSS